VLNVAKGIGGCVPRHAQAVESEASAQVETRGNDPRRGAEILEFTMAFLPLMVLLLVTANIAWAVFAKATLQRAVRMAVRSGVTLTHAQMTSGACLTDAVKDIVQQNSLGILNSTSGRSLIKVRYFQPPAPSSTADAMDVSTQLGGNQPGNIMEVSVEGFSLLPLAPRIFGWREAADTSPLVVNVSSADRIEPSRHIPCIGTAP
jgi:Flp pilus assembly protein TadG